jgi:hypothetical protein
MAPATQKKTEETTLGAIIAHPLRSQCLTLLADRTASPAELSIELGENLGNVSYHVRKLWKAGVVEIVEEKPVRGAMEHFYRAVVRPSISEDEIASVSIADRQTHAREAIALVTANASTAMKAETFARRTDYHVSRVPLRVDEDGWKEMATLFGETLERVFEIQEESAKRLGDTDEIGIPMIAFSTFFEMPERPKPE